jgi:hypothetical protein
VLLGIVVAQLSLHSVGAQQGMCDKGAWQPACDNVCPQLQAQVVPRGRGERAWAQAYASRSPTPGCAIGTTQIHTTQWERIPLDTGILQVDNLSVSYETVWRRFT